MNTVRLLTKSVVKRYYRQNAGLLLFGFLILIGVVGRLKYRGMLDTHYILIQGVLNDTIFLLVVFFIWLLYALKCVGFMYDLLQKPEYSFLNILSRLDKKHTYWLLLYVQWLLFIPVLFYALIMVGVAIYKHWYVVGALVLLFNIIVCIISAGWYQYQLYHPGKRSSVMQRMIAATQWGKSYAGFLVHYLFNRHKLLLFGIKLYNCGTLYLMLRNLTVEDYDIRMPFFFYSFGILGHGVLIHKMRALEDSSLFFYRGLPVSLFNRFMQYVIVCFLLLLPEIVTIVCVAPGYLQVTDAGRFIASGFSILLLLNSLLFTDRFTMRNYLKICFLIFCIVYFGVLAGVIAWLSLVFICLTVLLFWKGYYRYE